MSPETRKALESLLAATERDLSCPMDGLPKSHKPTAQKVWKRAKGETVELIKAALSED